MNKKSLRKLRYILTLSDDSLKLIVGRYQYLKNCVTRNVMKKRKEKLRLKDLKRFWYSLPCADRGNAFYRPKIKPNLCGRKADLVIIDDVLNEETKEAIEELERGEGEEFSSFKEMAEDAKI